MADNSFRLKSMWRSLPSQLRGGLIGAGIFFGALTLYVVLLALLILNPGLAIIAIFVAALAFCIAMGMMILGD